VWLKIYRAKGDLVPSIFEFLFDESEKAVESMTPTPKVPTGGAN
jgi:hypothetical protein